MSVSVGTRISTYEVTAKLGEGGMGEVYRARDTALNRDVAIKILPDSFAGDPERLARFEREAQVLAQLNHPHIAHIYGLEHAHRALVMELVEGEDLAARLTRGPLPIDEALAVARQLADALEAAHEQGIVHRDLKPANIKVRPDGTVKVLDFGLAKLAGAAAPDSTAAGLLSSPTITSPIAMTAHGMILGTAAYMAPEQARGKPVDRRADIWAFGCVVFEVLSGRRAFDGETVTDLLSAIVSREPDWSALPPATPPHVRALVQRCLVKDPRLRLRDIGDARVELSEARRPAAEAVPTASPPTRVQWIPWVIAAAAVVASAAVFLSSRGAPEPTTAPAATRFLVLPPEGVGTDVPGTVRYAGVVTVSPDGRRVAILATAPGGRLWIRDLNAIQPVQLKGTTNAQQPFWSPDGRHLGFFAQGRLRTVDVTTSAVQDVAPASARGGAWNAEGTILFVRNNELHRVPSRGGDPVAVTTVNNARTEREHGWPVFLPDGRRFLFHAETDNAETTGIHVGSLDSRETRFVVASPANAAYAPPGYLIYLRGTVLVAQPFDAGSATLTGEPHALVQQVAYNATNRHAEFSVSDTGVLAYAPGGLNDIRLGWFDRTGNKVGTVDAVAHMDISLDGSRVAADRLDPQTGMRDVWVFDQRRGSRTRLTFSAGNDWVPKWSPDATKVAFTSDRDTPGIAHIFVKAADGSGTEELLLKSEAHKHHMDWSRDGRWLVFESGSPPDLWALPMSGPREPTPVLEEPYSEGQPAFSPDARFLAYASNESGVFEVYVQSFPIGNGKWQVSTNGGIQPLWRGDGREMYYLAADGKVMALDIDLKTPSFGVPKPLFQTAVIGDATTEHIAVSNDGQRFLLQDAASAARAGFTVVLNWLAELPK